MLKDYEWFSASEAGERGHLLIFLVLVNPSPFRARGRGLTPSPPCDNGLSIGGSRRGLRWGRTLPILVGAKVGFTQCLQGFTACFVLKVNITVIVRQSAINGSKCWVFKQSLVLRVGHCRGRTSISQSGNCSSLTGVTSRSFMFFIKSRCDIVEPIER